MRSLLSNPDSPSTLNFPGGHCLTHVDREGFRPGPEATERHRGVNAWLPLLVSCFEEVKRAMRYLRIVLLLLAVTIGTQACYVAIGPDRGWHRHHEGGYEGR